ncbi:hypothetical protein [Yoonia sp. SS1-5]|uniref:Uncharacterized protein n=1 Tax=Yoonia rhodophyticola TaxID=3137370 RepID=A0AAN0M7H0_9RHOB
MTRATRALTNRFRGFKTLVRMNMDWLRFAVIVMIALYSSAYVMLS